MNQLGDHQVPITLPIGRRIGEIMDEKGGAFSQRSFAPRVGLSKDTLGRIIDGHRNAKPSELQRIAEGLHVSMPRLKQEDIFEAHHEVQRLLDHKKDIQRALDLSSKIHAVALGITESCDATLLLARAVYACGRYEEAHELLLESYRYAELIYVKYAETDRLYNVLSKLLVSYTIRKEYSYLTEILSKVEPIFGNDPDKQAQICFSKAMLAEEVGNVEQAGANLYKCLELYHQNGKSNDIGRAEINIGYFEFKQNNYETAKRHLESAISLLQDDTRCQLIAIKEYVKTLLKLGESEQAIHHLESMAEKADGYPELKGKCRLLMSLATGDASHAESVFTIPNVGKNVLKLACKYLIKHCIERNDAEGVMKFSILSERYSNPYDILNEGAFLV